MYSPLGILASIFPKWSPSIYATIFPLKNVFYNLNILLPIAKDSRPLTLQCFLMPSAKKINSPSSKQTYTAVSATDGALPLIPLIVKAPFYIVYNPILQFILNLISQSN
jgi:hypothetical protein